uniref:Uncharacterized protein n=1 Tax=Ananas comosus var. bracteatus TaxID=296719 RepID=A0A6V7PNM4_ANACO|nr:unnamed protein product [Ananas comosus var. bracteatus]
MLHSVDVAKTHEIMARFRPIAPRPAMPPQTPLHDVPSGLHQHQHQHQHQPCAMSAAAVAALQLRVRACRARKRGRPASCRSRWLSGRSRSTLCSRPPPPTPSLLPPWRPIVIPRSSLTGRRRRPESNWASTPQQRRRRQRLRRRVLSRPLLCGNSRKARKELRRSLNTLSPPLFPATTPFPPEVKHDVPVEQDLLQKLQEPKVITPMLVRPVASSITVGPITPDATAVPRPPFLQNRRLSRKRWSQKPSPRWSLTPATGFGSQIPPTKRWCASRSARGSTR